ncbi:hypothetical protein BCL69_100456 [Nitrosomonas communis]|uniref:CVNH domain-containing protein n=2 Tax=Nitrosomonas communis TaxID=44574 RepID=A0A5D3YKH6_9PROT|nr:hypothetical protein BCL69_100456 [Nitrosomonas communis]
MNLLAKSIIFGLLLSVSVTHSHAADYRICNMSANVTLSGYPDWWYFDNSSSYNFSLAPGGSTDLEKGSCIKGLYSSYGASPGCSYENQENCTWNRSSTCESSTFVYGTSTDGTVEGWQSVDGVMDCLDAANQIMQCQQAGYDSVGPCRCTRIGSHCSSIFSEVACMFACMLSNAGQTGGGEPVGGEGGEDTVKDEKLRAYIRQQNIPSLK